MLEIDIDQIKKEMFKATPSHLIADIIAENNPGVKRITSTIIETYLELAASKDFTLDKTITEIRRLNKFDNLIENKLSFTLEDGSVVVVSDELMGKMQESINNTDVVEFMRKNKENFMDVVDILGEENGKNNIETD